MDRSIHNATVQNSAEKVMIVLINGGGNLDQWPSPHVGRLLSPLAGNAIPVNRPWAADNGAYSGFDAHEFKLMLRRAEASEAADRCLFVTVPDVVADAAATVEMFWRWGPTVARHGLPLAFVGQDGAERMQLPWDSFGAYFVGGSDEWKLSPESGEVAAEAKRRGKHLHMGRVNTRRRMRVAKEWQCDSFDGTGWSMFFKTYMQKELPYLRGLNEQGRLFVRRDRP